MYHATRGGGAYRGAQRLAANEPVELGQALLATGFSYDAARRGEQDRLIADVLPRIGDVRRGGSAAVDLADVAAGRADAFFEDELNRWDVAAAALIAVKAGAVVGLDVGATGAPRLSVLAAGPSLYPAIADALGFAGRG